MIKNGAQFTCQKREDALVVQVRGEIDHHSAVAVRTELDEKITAERPSRVILELSAVDFMDSSGLGLIMGRYALMKEIGGDMVVTDPAAGVEKVLKLAGLERMVRIERKTAREVPQSAVQDKPRVRRTRKEVLK